jgi:hypothetical protein
MANFGKGINGLEGNHTISTDQNSRRHCAGAHIFSGHPKSFQVSIAAQINFVSLRVGSSNCANTLAWHASFAHAK